MLNELQSSYDELLHKYAAAENALDKVSSFKQCIDHHFDESFAEKVLSSQVRFGAAPPPGCGDREEAFMLADKVLLQQSVFTIGEISIVIVIKYVGGR